MHIQQITMHPESLFAINEQKWDDYVTKSHNVTHSFPYLLSPGEIFWRCYHLLPVQQLSKPCTGAIQYPTKLEEQGWLSQGLSLKLSKEYQWGGN